MRTDGLSETRLARMRAVMASHVERGALPGLVTLISRRGEVTVETVGMHSFGGSIPMRRDTIFRIASLTKPIVAVAAMILVEECTLRLDDPVDPWLPELADRQVLRRPDGPLDDTEPAHRPITLRDLLTFRLGFGMVLGSSGESPIQRAISEVGLDPAPDAPPVAPDEWMRRLGRLPLIYQPGETWMYHTGSDILGVLIARASGQSLGSFLHERIFEPLGMKDTGFYVPADKLERVPHCYRADTATGGLTVYAEPDDPRWSRPPAFESGGAGLVSTADDLLAFYQMLLNKGRYGGERILSRLSVELMTTDHLTPEQKAGPHVVLESDQGWGFGLGVVTRRERLASVPGRFGWSGGFGTTVSADPQEELVAILMTQLMMDSPDWVKIYSDFWTSVYQAIDD